MSHPSESLWPDLHEDTQLVHAGTLRSQFGETSEALFLTQGHVYDSAEQCEARFLGEDPGFIYARFSNPLSRCSRSAWRPSKAPRLLAPRPRAWRR